MATIIGGVTIRIGATVNQLKYDLKSAERSLKASADRFKSIGANLSLGVTAPILALGAKALSVTGDIEALQKGLISVMGSAKAAGDEFERLKEVAKLPGLGLEEAVQGSVALQAAGFSADEARSSLLAFGNALATVGKGKNELKLVNLALTQLQNKSSGYGQEIRQLTEQLPQLRNALVSAFGTAESDKIAELGVTGKEVVSILTQEFAKLPKVSGGLKNSFENAGDAIKIALFNVGTAINKNLDIEGIVTRVSDRLVAMADAFGKLDAGTQKMILGAIGLVAALGPLSYIMGNLTSLYSAIIIPLTRTAGLMALNATASTAAGVAATGAGAATLSAGKLMTLAMGPVGIAIAGVAAAIYVIYKNWDQVKSITIDVGNYFIELYNESVLVRIGVEAIVAQFKLVYSAIKLVVDLFSSGFKAAFGFVSNGFKTLGNLIKAVLSGNFSEIPSILSDGFKTSTKNGKEFITNLGKDFRSFGEDLYTNTNTQLQRTFDPKKIELFKQELTKPIFIDIGFNKPKEAAYTPIGVLAPKVAEETKKPFTPKGDSAKVDLTPLQELEKKFIEIDTLVKNGFLLSLDAVDKKIDEIDKAAEGLAQKGLKNTSVEFKKLRDIAEGLKTEGIDISVGLNTLPLVQSLKSIEDPIKSITEKIKGAFIGEKDYFKTFADKAIEAANKIKEKYDLLADRISRVGQIGNAIGDIFSSLSDRENEKNKEKEIKEKEAVSNSILNEDQKAQALLAIEAKYNKERQKANKKQAIANKALGIFNATVSMFEGIARAVALGPAGIPLIPFIKGLGLLNIAAIASAPLPSLKIGTNYVKSDGLANIHKGEAIVPAKVVGGGFNLGGGMHHSVIRGQDIHLVSNFQAYIDKRTR